jgi:hypothetical protein
VTDDDLIRKRAKLDQALAGLLDVARMMAGYRRELIDAGVPPADALLLTISAQTALLTQRPKDEEDE